MAMCKVVDSAQPGCKQGDMDTIFKAANFEVKGADPDDENPLEVNTRSARSHLDMLLAYLTWVKRVSLFLFMSLSFLLSSP